MLTKERVLGTSWSYTRRQQDVDYDAHFEILKVEPDGKLGIYIYWRDKELELTELQNLSLESLEDLVQRGRIRELTDTTETARDEDSGYLTELTVVGALALSLTFGLWTFIAGIKGPHQKPWEVAIGAAFMISALLAVAIRRR